MTSPRMIVAVALVVALSGTAHGADLFSPPLTAGDGNVLLCQIANVSAQNRTVTIEVYGFCTSACPSPGDGNLLGSATSILGPMATGELGVFDLSSPPITPHVCKFIVQGGKGSYRASACVQVGPASTTCVPAD